MSTFARARFRRDLAWENSEKHLIATYRSLLLNNESQTLLVQSGQPNGSSLQGSGD
jgi:hypothetical protein